MASSSFAANLQNSIHGWDQQVREIQEPDVTFHQELSLLYNHSRTLLEQFALDPSRDDISLVQRALLADGRHIRELELRHEATSQKIEGLAGQIITDLLKIFGLEKLQDLVPELRSPEVDPRLAGCPSDGPLELSSGFPPAEQTREILPRTLGYTTRPNDQMTCPFLNSPITAKELKRKSDTDSTDTTNKRRSVAVEEREDQDRRNRLDHPSPPAPTPAEHEDSYKHETGQKALIRKRGRTLAKKALELGIDGHTACFLVYRNPTHHEWVCAAHIPKGLDVPSLDTIVADYLERQIAAEPMPGRYSGAHSSSMSPGSSEMVWL